MFRTNSKFSKVISVICLVVLLSLSSLIPAFANAPTHPEHWPCPGYYGSANDPYCQGYYGYQPYADPCWQPDYYYYNYQYCQGYQGYPYYPTYQGCQGPGCPGTPVAPTSTPVTPANNSPDTAAMLGSGGSTIAARAQQWYTFPVNPPLYGDNSRGTLNIDISVANMSGHVSFQVLTSNAVNQWENGVQYSPVGAGSESTNAQGQPILFWSGSFNVPLTIYVLVSNNADQPASYTLSLVTRNG